MKKLSFKRKRIRSIESHSILPPFLVCLFNPYTIASSYKLADAIIADFFMCQFLRKMHIYKTPVIHVDHPLDQKVPFTPSKVKVYMNFTKYWIRPLTMLYRHYGFFKVGPIFNDWLVRLTKVYRQAGRMYRFRMSTTYRPLYLWKSQFRKIYAGDPHYMCVPSLHISIITLTHAFYKDLFSKTDDFTQEEKDFWYKELYDGAVEIGETVLYVKQHSVNCISAALYMMTRLIPDIFTPEDATKYIDSLFQKSTDIAEEDKAAIREHIQFLYERFLLEGEQYDDWIVPVERWILQYAAVTGQGNGNQGIVHNTGVRHPEVESEAILKNNL